MDMMTGTRATPRRRRREAGVAAIEFAMVLPLLVAMVLGIVYYGMVLALEQTLTLAAAEGARAALRYPPGAPDGSVAATQSLRVTAARQTALAALPDSIQRSLAGTGEIASADVCPAPAETVCVNVTLRLPVASVLPPVPFVPVPDMLTGSAVAQLAADL